jgi:hypothetical protein
MCGTENADAGVVYQDSYRSESGLRFRHQSVHIGRTGYIRYVGEYASSQAREFGAGFIERAGIAAADSDSRSQ